MDLEQIIKRLEWLDDERRRDKTTIATLEERLAILEGTLPGVNQQLKALDTETTRLSTLLARFDQVDAAMGQMRVEFSRMVDGIEKQRNEREREQEKQHRGEMELVNKSVADLRKAVETLPDIRKSVQARVEEEFRLSRQLDELANKFSENSRSEEEYRRTLKLLDENRRQDTKRLTDIQGELSALRKRIDEQRNRSDLAAEGLRKLEMRFAELQAAEGERRQAQTSFIEKQNLMNVERERVWKDWQTRFDEISRQAANLESQMQTLETTHRAVKRSQEAFDEVTQKFERRVNEITEMQRLAEERFRQEWVTFKADDQKRWTNYMLAQEEQQREIMRQYERMLERLVRLEDSSQEARDILTQFLADYQKRMQSMLSLYHQSVEDLDRNFNQPVRS